MTAVLGGDADELDALLDQLGLIAANRNGAGQTVVAGPLDALAELAAARPRRPGSARLPSPARSTPRPWSPPAASPRSAARRSSPRSDPQPRPLSNADGAVVTTGAVLLARLVAQVAAAGSLGPLPAADDSTSGSPRCSSWPRAAPSPASPSARCPASRSSRSRPPTTSTAARGLLASRAALLPRRRLHSGWSSLRRAARSSLTSSMRARCCPPVPCSAPVRTSRAEHPVPSPHFGSPRRVARPRQ